MTGGGNDDVLGGFGNDKISTGKGHDDIDGGEGNDKLVGGDGNDSMIGGLGVDSMSGGDGLDLADYDEEDRAASAFFVDFELELETALLPTNGPSDAEGDAWFEVEQEAHEYEVEFEVDISDASANTLYDVFVDEVFVGQLLTDGSGWGAIQLSNDPDDTDEILFPKELSFSVGSTVTIQNHETGITELDGVFRDAGR